MTAQERVKCLACNGHGGDGGQADNGTWEWPCEVCNGKRTVTAQELADTAVQSSRDQGIADACEGRAPRCWSTPHGDVIFMRTDRGAIVVLPPSDSDYRSAFAYARAYEANK